MNSLSARVASLQSRPGLVRRALAGLYGWFLSRRNRRFDTGGTTVTKVSCPVFSIGNLTVGGTGKTPMVAWLTDALLRSGRRPAIVSRGYGGHWTKSRREPGVVSDGQGIRMGSGEAGDEPVMLAQQNPEAIVVVARRRAEGARLAIEGLGADAVILDDGFQHRFLARNLDLVMLDARAPFGNGFLLPAGPLREPPESLARADVVVLNHAEDVADLSDLEGRVRELAPEALVCHAGYTVLGLRRPDGESLPSEELRGKRVMIFSGLANPGGFRRTIESCGAEVVAERLFPDHYDYRGGEVREVREQFRKVSAELLVTSAKDAARLTRFLEGDPPVLALEIELEIGSGREELLGSVREVIG